MEERSGAVRLTLANLWRLSWLEGPPGLILQTFDLAQGRWREQAPETITWHKWGHVLKWPYSAENIWPDLEASYRPGRAGPDLFKNLMAAWLEKVLPALRSELKPSPAPADDEWCFQDEYLFAHFISRWFLSLPADYRSGVIDSALKGYIWSREFPLFPQPHNIRLFQVLEAQSADLARIERESPNILPLLHFIPTACWSRRDLLQDKVLRAASPVFENFSPAGLRWLRRAPAETLAYFHRCFVRFKNKWPMVEQPWPAGEVAELMAALPPQATDQPELAEAVMVSYGELLDDIHEKGPNLPFNLQVLEDRLLRLQARHIVARWDSSENPQEELESIKAEVREEREYILDWFNAEGPLLGLPDKNSTWRSLKRRSDKWHEDFRRAEPREELRPELREALWAALVGDENSAWDSLLGKTVIDGLKVTPLITGRDLCNESSEMGHCVITYATRCVNKGWRVFSLKEADGTRSTLSLKPGYDGCFTIDQHKGPENAPVSPAAAKVGREVCRLYNRKCREAAETDLTGAAA